MESVVTNDVLFAWLLHATRLPSRSVLEMAVFLQCLSHRYERRTFILLTPELLDLQGFTRVTAYRALVALEAAGLVEVKRQRGSAPLVSIVDADHGGTPS